MGDAIRLQKEKNFQDKAAAKRQRQGQQASKAIENSFPAQLLERLAGAAVPVCELCSDELKAEAAKHGDAVAAIRTQLKAGVAELSKALENAASADGGYGDVYAAIEAVRFDRASLAQQTVAVWTDAHELAGRVRDELAPFPQRLSDEAETVVAVVKKKLTEIGSGVESQVAWGKNANAAERQFNSVARMNLIARKAIAAAANARGELEASNARTGVTLRGLERARDFLHSVVLKAIKS